MVKCRRKRIIFIALSLLVVLGCFGFYKYNALPSHFILGGLRFQLTDNVFKTVPNDNSTYSKSLGKQIGEIETQTYLYPKADGQGFKVPAGSVVYRLSSEGSDKAYDVILQTPEGNLYIAALYSSQSSRQEVLLQFDEQFRK